MSSATPDSAVRLDARQGVPVLIEALGDNRARFAIYALRKVFSELAREDALAELRAVPTTKVTVAKEVLRSRRVRL